MEQKVKTELLHGGTVARIILDDGKGNVLDVQMIRELKETLEAQKVNSRMKLITLEGAGGNFSFGASVEEHKKEAAPQMLRIFHRLFYTILEMNIPMLAKVSGQCLGGGMELAAVCHVLMADQSALFGQPEIRLGVFAPVASVLLPLKISRAAAEEMLISGKTISAGEAKAAGLVNEVFGDKDGLEAGTAEWIAKNIHGKSASSLRFSVRASRLFLTHVMTKFLPQAEEIYLEQLMETPDANEGIAAFLEKRKPVWQGK